MVIEKLNNKKILITGGAGFIGSQLAAYILDNTVEAEVTIFDCFRGDSLDDVFVSSSLGHFENIKNLDLRVIVGDLSERRSLDNLERIEFDIIFHQAAISDTTMHDQAKVLQTNMTSFEFFLEYCKGRDIPLVYASSAATYGDVDAPQTVGRENPLNVYGYSKLMMDRMAFQARKVGHSAPIIGLRYFNVYGPGEFFKGKTASVCMQIALNLLDGRQPVLFEESALYKRDFVYINDVISANISAALCGESGIFNVGSGSPRSFYDVFSLVSKYLDIPIEPKFIVNPHAAYQKLTLADIQDSKDTLGYQPAYDLEKGISDYCSRFTQTYELHKRFPDII